jgi:hypothetical protein
MLYTLFVSTFLVLCLLKTNESALMGAFAETGNVDYRLLFASQGKQTSVFRMQKTNISLPLSVNSVFCIYKYMLKWQFIYGYKAIDIHISI